MAQESYILNPYFLCNPLLREFRELDDFVKITGCDNAIFVYFSKQKRQN